MKKETGLMKKQLLFRQLRLLLLLLEDGGIIKEHLGQQQKKHCGNHMDLLICSLLDADFEFVTVSEY